MNIQTIITLPWIIIGKIGKSAHKNREEGGRGGKREEGGRKGKKSGYTEREESEGGGEGVDLLREVGVEGEVDEVRRKVVYGKIEITRNK